MAKVVHKSYNQNDNLLFPHCIGDFIPANDPVRVLDAIVERLDISAIEATYKGGGASSFAPRMLLKVVLYAYLQNIYSGRKMEKFLKRDVNFMWLSGMQSPDYNTINLFRKNRLADFIDNIFTQVVRMLVDAKFISLEVQYVDGTKIEANANRYTFVWKKATKTNQGKLDVKVKDMLREAEKQLDMELREEGPEIMTAAEMAERTDEILMKMDEKGICDKKLHKALSKVKEESVPKMKEYEEKLEIVGDRSSYSKTDKDATFMRMKEDAMRNGQTKPGYNLQIGTENQFITDFALFPNPTDTLTMIPFLQSFSGRYDRLAHTVVADSGYGSEENYRFMSENGMEAYVKYNYFHMEQRSRFKPDPFKAENFYYNEEHDFCICPMGQKMQRIGTGHVKTASGYVSGNARYRAVRCEGCPLRYRCFKAKGNRTIELNHRLRKYRQKAKELLCSKEGLKHRGQRCIEPEAVFGQMKNNMNYKRFRHFGKDKVFMDFAFFAIAFNIKKMCAKMTKEGMDWLIRPFYELTVVLFRCCERINQRNPQNIAA